MSIFKRAIGRREFLQRVAGQFLAIMIAPPYLKELISPDAANAAGQCSAYGSGPYGQGPYCGSAYQICLPIITKKEN